MFRHTQSLYHLLQIRRSLNTHMRIILYIRTYNPADTPLYYAFAAKVYHYQAFLHMQIVGYWFLDNFKPH